MKELYGAEYHNQRQYQTKVRNAQEAHEAIRPTHFHRTPASLEKILETDELKVYELIWKRAVASQMADAKMLRTTVEITGETNDGAPATFNASGKAIEFPGYLRAYVEGSDDPSAELADQDTVLPKLAVGDQVWSPDKLDQGTDPPRPRCEGPRDLAAGALHRSVAREAARRRRHRPPVDLRADGGDHSAPRLHLAPGQGAGAELHRVRRHAPAAQSLRRLRRHRLHRGDGRDPRQDLERREGLAGVPRRVLSRRQEASRPRAPRRGQGPVDRIPDHRARPGSRKQPAGARPHRPLRSVPAARRSERRRPARVAARRSGAGRSDAREGDRAAQGQGAGAEVARRRSGDAASTST